MRTCGYNGKGLALFRSRNREGFVYEKRTTFVQASQASEPPTPRRRVEERLQTFRQKVDENLGRAQNARRSFESGLNRPRNAQEKEGTGEDKAPAAVPSLPVGKIAGAASQRTVAVTFKLDFKCEPWQHIRIVGSHQSLGSWRLASSLVMKWQEGHKWEAKIHLPAGGVYEYKYVLCEETPDGVRSVVWQVGNNAVLALSTNDGPTTEVCDNWAGEPGAVVLSRDVDNVSALVAPVTRESKLLKYVEETETLVSDQQAEIRALQAEIELARADLRSLRAQNSTMKKQMMDLEVEMQGEKILRQELENAMEDLQDVVEGTFSSLEIKKNLRAAEEKLAQKEKKEAALEEINYELQHQIKRNSTSFHEALTTFERLVDVALEQ